MTIKRIRALTGLSQAKFAAKYHIPLATLENWERGIRTAPPYVIELLYFRVICDVRQEEYIRKRLADIAKEHGELL